MNIDKPVRIFGENIEEKALAQFYSAMAEDYAVKGALMPDAHVGYALPIGAVVATRGVVVPAWVGYDIGCGMCAIPTTFAAKDIKANSELIFDRLYQVIPVGHQVNVKPLKHGLEIDGLTERGKRIFASRKGARALGTLGSGNHFIEIGVDEREKVWVIIHSGSRGFGHGIATEYMKIAGGGKAREGHFGLDAESKKGQDYLTDASWAEEYALANRCEMMKKTVKILEGVASGVADWDGLINRNHNHVEKRDDLWIHRKGATHAEKGMMGVVPGNMKDGSFIVQGKGNPDSLYSSSHGAGRVLGRNQAKKILKLNHFVETMAGVMARVNRNTLDESPMAYKNIFEVMKLQSELVDVVAHVKPLLNIKG